MIIDYDFNNRKEQPAKVRNVFIKDDDLIFKGFEPYPCLLFFRSQKVIFNHIHFKEAGEVDRPQMKKKGTTPRRSPDGKYRSFMGCLGHVREASVPLGIKRINLLVGASVLLTRVGTVTKRSEHEHIFYCYSIGNPTGDEVQYESWTME